MLRSPAVEVVISILIVLVLYLVRTRYCNGLNKIPGPFSASLTSLWKFQVVLKERMPFISTELHEKHGPLVRIGPNHISASSAESIQAVHRSRTGFTKSGMYSILLPMFKGSILHNIFSIQDEEFHAALKRAMGTLYSRATLLRRQHALPNFLSCE